MRVDSRPIICERFRTASKSITLIVAVHCTGNNPGAEYIEIQGHKVRTHQRIETGLRRIGRAICRLGLFFFVAAASMPVSSGKIGDLNDEFVAAFAKQYGDPAKTRLLEWRDLMSAGLKSPGGIKREIANDFFNRIPWLDDADHWGRADYWATPMEMLGTYGGDCEDYSIAKYFTLIEMDVPGAQLLITYVRAPALTQSHMVLAYYPTPDADPLILDNIIGEIRRGSERPDLIPVYSFNGDGLWVAVQRSLGRNVGDASRLAQWRDVLRRMEAEKSLSN